MVNFELTPFVDLVREVHEATKLREDTLMARMRAFSDNFNHSQAMISSVSYILFYSLLIIFVENRVSIKNIYVSVLIVSISDIH